MRPSVFSVVGGTAALLLILSAPESATDGARGNVDASSNGENATVRVQDAKQVGGDGGSSGDGSVPVEAPANFDPPPCWYVETYTPAQMKHRVEQINHQAKKTLIADAETRQNWEESFGDYHKGDKGMWWESECSDPSSDEALAWMAEHELFVWVPQREEPPEEAVDPEVLMKVALADLTVPEPTVRVNPSGRSYVGLPTWVWIERSDVAGPFSETASIPNGPSATVKASEPRVKIDPGAPGEWANVHECSGTGKPYTKGTDASAVPPCGVTYKHASTGSSDQSYDMTVTVVWQVSWSGSDGTTNEPLTDVTVSTTEEISVAEIQTKVTD